MNNEDEKELELNAAEVVIISGATVIIYEVLQAVFRKLWRRRA